MHIIHTISSTEILSSGITHCVNELSTGLDKLGEDVQVLSLGLEETYSNNKKIEQKFRNDYYDVPFLHQAGISKTMKQYISGLLRFFLHFLWFSYPFHWICCKGRIATHTFQISLKPAQILPLRISSVFTPCLATSNQKDQKSLPPKRNKLVLLF